MGRLRETSPVKLFCGILARSQQFAVTAIERLEGLVGPADFCSLPIPFDQTEYYREEMGAGLVRFFVSFEQWIDPPAIARIKIATNSIEESLSDALGRRTVNLDPGYLSLHSVLLASTKNFQHRIPLGGGVYIEQELFFTKRSVRFLPWTYPDYRSPAYVELFLLLRRLAREGTVAKSGQLD